MELENYLKKYFGIDKFRDKQKETVESLLAKKNTLCLMPTGMGKSLTYQLTTIINNKLTIVISPLIALMEQQNDALNNQLNSWNLFSYAFNSNQDKVVTQFKYLTESFLPPNNPRFLFVSPEKMMLDGYAEFIFRKYKKEIGLIVIDEAHCVSQWGHSFRPAYKMIPKFLDDIFGVEKPPVLCLTATINQRDKEEIIKDFDIESVIQSDNLMRNNIELHIEEQVKKNDEKKIKLTEILEEFKDEKIIVYTHIKKREYGTREMANTYKELGYNCDYFDSDLNFKDKDRVLNDFAKGKIKIIFATNAFGMGIDIPDIRCVVHYQIPENLEQYYQEVGRAGRDGNPSFAYLLHAEPNLRIKRDQINKSAIKEADIKKQWDIVTNERGVGHIGKWGQADSSEDNLPLMIFSKFIEKGFVQLLCKGVYRIDCFENTSNNSFFNQYLKTNKHTQIISKRTGEPLDKVNEKIFQLISNREIKLSKSPEKVLFYKVTKDLEQQDFDLMAEEFNLIRDYKIAGLKKLNDVLSSDINIEDALKEHLAIIR